MAEAALTIERIRADVADVLYLAPEEIGDDTHLIDQGLDSVRLMTLVERWRADGADVEFVDLADLAAEPTVRRWSELLGR
jgi:aryl carrier-like protein